MGDGEPVRFEAPFGIPNTWSWSRLSALCYPQERPDTALERFRYIDIDSINNKKGTIESPKSLSSKDAPSRANRKLRTGSTLFSMVRPYLRNIAFVDDSLSDSIASTGFYVASPISSEALQKWLYSCMNSEYFVGTINSFMKGDNSPSVRKDEMDAMLIPIPCENEQERIYKIVYTALSLLAVH